MTGEPSSQKEMKLLREPLAQRAPRQRGSLRGVRRRQVQDPRLRQAGAQSLVGDHSKAGRRCGVINRRPCADHSRPPLSAPPFKLLGYPCLVEKGGRLPLDFHGAALRCAGRGASLCQRQSWRMVCQSCQFSPSGISLRRFTLSSSSSRIAALSFKHRPSALTPQPSRCSLLFGLSFGSTGRVAEPLSITGPLQWLATIGTVGMLGQYKRGICWHHRYLRLRSFE